MVRNSGVVAVLILMLAVFWVGGETTFLAPYKRLLFTQYGVHIGLFLLVVFVNLFAAFYGLLRLLFLKHTGLTLQRLAQKLANPVTLLPHLPVREDASSPPPLDPVFCR